MTTDIPPNARLVGRIWRPKLKGPSVILIRDNVIFDITQTTPTITDFLESDACRAFDELEGERLGAVQDFIRRPEEMGNHSNRACLLAPCDLQALKACGVTFANSMIERVIDERTSGDPERATEIRKRIGDLIGGSLANVQAGSHEAEHVRSVLKREELWSQYLEVGIGPDAEVFTKAQPMSAVGHAAQIGINTQSHWNNPEPEIVVAVNSRGDIRGATLGNDVNLRDFEGRSALLLGKAKDNNASCAIGPFIRLFDDEFTLADIEKAELSLSVKGRDGFELTGHSNMAEISRRPVELVRQTLDEHQYPDGFMLFLGTMFAPTQDRGTPGNGFTHHEGDVVKISTPLLGSLSNTITTCDKAAPWNFGVRALMQNLTQREVLK